MAKTKHKSTVETPLMKQYNAIKKRYPGALLLFRVGDFYETFGEDAIKASSTLDIVLTKRANGAASHIELAGFPHHSLDSYLPRLVRAGHRVAICDQLEDPKSVKGIVKRGVTELVTPGLSMHDNVLDKKTNNFLASLCLKEEQIGIAFLDLSTGEFMVSMGSWPYIEKLMQSFQPSELIFHKSHRSQIEQHFGDTFNTYGLEDWVYGPEYGYEKLTTQFGTANLKGFGIEEMHAAVVAAGAILYYLEDTEHKDIRHIRSISRIEEEKYVWLDKFTIRNLELLTSQQADGIPLIDVLDHTHTAMGSRMLKKWVILPLKTKEAIDRRLGIVNALSENDELVARLVDYLKPMADLERLISKVAVGRINPREFNLLKKALGLLGPVKELLLGEADEALQQIGSQIDPCDFLYSKIDKLLKEEVPIVSNQGNLINDGIDEELDDLRKIAYSGKDYLMDLQAREKERTGITSLKIAYNKVFGYYLEVSNAHKDKVPGEWIRKQTLVNAERYITEELKIYEEKIISAEDKMVAIESRIYLQLIQDALEFVPQVQRDGQVVASLDCLISFALLSRKNNYGKPHITEDMEIDIKEGRHPVIEQHLPPGESYVPNDVFLDDASQQLMIITGPNMAGKSALLRQTALIVLMAQMGCHVPATYARIGLVDKVFTRVGASDNLSKGESTFMVEMTETASILNNLSSRSLILMDEIGRGTSTYDGISIAWAIVEYLHKHPKFKAKTLFATHYHELNQLTQDFPRIKNFNVSVREMDNKVIFMRKLVEGGSEHSFGIHVAQMAGMPNEVVIRAHEIMQHLEKDKLKEKDLQKLQDLPKSNFQMSLFEADPHFEEIRKILNAIDINRISPVEALLKLNEIKSVLKG